MLLGDQGSVTDLRAALETTASQARKLSADGRALVQDLLITGGPFPQRLHPTERLAAFYGSSFRS